MLINLQLFRGRGNTSGSGGGSKFVSGNTFNEFLNANRDDPEFKQFVRENGLNAARELWRDQRIAEERNNIHEISTEEAIGIVTNAMDSGTRNGWFVNYDSDYKPKVLDAIVSNPGALNAGLNIAYQNYRDASPSNNLSFNKWLNIPQTMYRGDRGQATTKSDLFTSFTPNKSVAQSFGSHLTTKAFKPIDTLGSYQTTGEQEFLVRVKPRK